VSRQHVAALALIVALALAGCGGGGESSTTQGSTTTATPPPKETRDALPDRPREWERFVNGRGGYALLLPRGWVADADGPQTLVRSFDRLVAISIAPDRSAPAARTPLSDYATRTADELRGFRGGFDAEGTRRFPGRYDAVDVFGTGRSRDGIEQDVSVIVLRRDELVTITALVAASARSAADESRRLARKVVATIRTRPPSPRSAGQEN